MRLVLLVLAALSLGCATGRTGQARDIGLGEYVRFTLSDPADQRFEGEVVGIRNEQLTVGIKGGGPVQVPLEAVTSLAVKTGTKRNLGRGAAIGLGAGVVFFVGVAATEEGNASGDIVALAFGVIAGSGALIGALIGLSVETDQWEEQSIPLTVGLAGADGAVTLGWSVSVGHRRAARE
jgi:hypothetical protein